MSDREERKKRVIIVQGAEKRREINLKAKTPENGESAL